MTGAQSNPFALLASGGSDRGPAPSKNKKKSKKKKAVVVDQETASMLKPSTITEEPSAGDDSFQPVNKPKHCRGSGKQPKPGQADNGHGLSPFALEQAASSADREARSLLLLEWQIKAARDVDFRSTIANSCALERLLEGLASAAVSDDADILSSLLSYVAHPSVTTEVLNAAAAAVVAAGCLAHRDALAPTPQAMAAATAAAVLLKQGLPDKSAAASHEDALLAALATAQSRIAALEAALDRVGAAVPAKEEVRLAIQLFEATREGTDLVDPEACGGAPPQAAALLSALGSLRGALAARQLALSGLGDAASAEEQVAAAQRAAAREDAVLKTEEIEAEAKVAELEKQLVAARAAAEGIRARRAATKQQTELSIQALRNGAVVSAATLVEISAQVEEAQGHVGHLDAALKATVGASAAAAAAAALKARWAEAGVPARFAAATLRLLDASAKQLRELGGKAAFYRERLATSAAQAEDVASLGDAGIVANHKKQHFSLQGLLQEALNAAAGVDRATQAAVEEWRTRKAKLKTQGGAEGLVPADLSERIDAAAVELMDLSEDIAAGRLKATPAAVASKVAGPSRGGSKGSDSASNGDTTAAAAAAAAPPAELIALEQRLAALEEENRKKDEQIADMLAAAAVSLPSPEPPMPPPMKPAWGRAI